MFNEEYQANMDSLLNQIEANLQYPEEAKREGIASVLSIPITVKGQIIGVLRIN